MLRNLALTQYQKVKALYLRYERLLMPATLLVGFLIDYLTFTNVEINITLTLLLVYWIIAGMTIFFIHLYDAGKVSQKLRYVRLFAPLLIQFTFGALLGGSFIFYWFSGSISVSWPFILVIIALMISNDVFRHHFMHPVVQLSVYYFITLSLFSVVLPFLLNNLGPQIFLLAGAGSVAVIFLFIRLLAAVRELVRQQKRNLFSSIFLIFFLMNVFYFANIIPPIPLSLREAGVYHNIYRSGGNYILRGEYETFWQKLVPGQTIHLRTADRAYVYTAIFAPGELRTRVYHNWQFYNEQTNTWESKDRPSFEISGGRRAGYRGYSWKTNLTPGTWRVHVETERGQVLGSLRFKIVRVDSQPELLDITR